MVRVFNKNKNKQQIINNNNDLEIKNETYQERRNVKSNQFEIFF